MLHGAARLVHRRRLAAEPSQAGRAAEHDGRERLPYGDARGVGVEDARANAPVFEEVDEEVRLGEIGCGVDPLQKRYESMPLTPSWLIPERPDTLTYETLTPMRSMTVPAMPMAPVVKVLPGL